MNKYLVIVGALTINVIINIAIKRHYMSLNIDLGTISTAELNDILIKKYLLISLNNFTLAILLFFTLKKVKVLTWKKRLLIAVCFLVVTYIFSRAFF